MRQFIKFLKQKTYLFVAIMTLILSLIFAGGTLLFFNIQNDIDLTSLGFIYLGNYSTDEYDSVLSENIASWKTSSEYTIFFQEYELEINLTYFYFDLEQTLLSITKNTENVAYFSLTMENQIALENDLIDQFSETTIAQINFDAFLLDLNQDMMNLSRIKTYDLRDYLDEYFALSVINEIEVTQINEEDINEITQAVSSIVIFANQRFSLLNELLSYDLSNEQMSIIASGIQELTLQTNFTEFNFLEYLEMPEWASLGKNVRILEMNQFDFSFYNPLEEDFLIVIEQKDDLTLTFQLKGFPYITTFTISSELVTVTPFHTIVLNNDLIDEFTPLVTITETDTEYVYSLLVQSGVNGNVTSIYRTSINLFGEEIISKLYDCQIASVNEIYYENIVLKGSD
ncbi:MAG: hypothetical protein KJ971_08460 [Firmicutes bacterium]|nr:hypothetical protein [Bacillota bacterium]